VDRSLYILTVNYYSTPLIERLINSCELEKIAKIIIINNSPDDLELKNLATSRVKIIEAKVNLGFGKACNLGLNCIYSQNPQSIVWLINPDAYLITDTLEKVPKFITNYPELSLIGTKIYTPTGETWFAGGRFFANRGAIVEADLLSANPNTAYVHCDWISGCSLIINLSHFSECPQFDSAYFLYYEDFDFCRRYAARGHQIAITSKLAIIHQPSMTTDRNLRQKFRHSTYSYLLTLKRYTSQSIFRLRCLRLLLYALFLLPFKPQTAWGKLEGIVAFYVFNS
jgi:N-acetylglucosaminyl-diphospho-decaprenol L-rhamnosyltransferase